MDNESVKALNEALQEKQLQVETELSRTAQVLGLVPTAVAGTLDQRILGIAEASAQMTLLQKQAVAEEARADKATAALESANRELEETRTKLVAEQNSRAIGERAANSEAATALDHVRAELDEARRNLLTMERQEDDFRAKVSVSGAVVQGVYCHDLLLLPTTSYYFPLLPIASVYSVRVSCSCAGPRLTLHDMNSRRLPMSTTRLLSKLHVVY